MNVPRTKWGRLSSMIGGFACALALMAAVLVMGSTSSRTQQELQRDVIQQLADRGVPIVPDDRGRVVSLLLRGRPIEVRDLETMTVLSEVQYVDLGNTPVDDSGLRHIAELKSLEKLYLTNTAVTDAGLPYLADLPNLTVLDLSGTRVSDSGLSSIMRLANLDFLLVEGTRVTDVGADAVRAALPQCHVRR